MRVADGKNRGLARSDEGRRGEPEWVAREGHVIDDKGHEAIGDVLPIGKVPDDEALLESGRELGLEELVDRVIGSDDDDLGADLDGAALGLGVERVAICPVLEHRPNIADGGGVLGKVVDEDEGLIAVVAPPLGVGGLKEQGRSREALEHGGRLPRVDLALYPEPRARFELSDVDLFRDAGDGLKVADIADEDVGGDVQEVAEAGVVDGVLVQTAGALSASVDGTRGDGVENAEFDKIAVFHRVAGVGEVTGRSDLNVGIAEETMKEPQRGVGGIGSVEGQGADCLRQDNEHLGMAAPGCAELVACDGIVDESLREKIGELLDDVVPRHPDAFVEEGNRKPTGAGRVVRGNFGHKKGLRVYGEM